MLVVLINTGENDLRELCHSSMRVPTSLATRWL